MDSSFIVVLSSGKAPGATTPLLILPDRAVIMMYPREAKVVEHRYFGGLTNKEIAETLSVSLSTVERDLRFARAWLSEKWSGDLDL